jgi:hypothetical protein
LPERLPSIGDPLFLLTDGKRKVVRSSIRNSKFDGATFTQPQFHSTEIIDSSFVGTKLSNPLFFKGTNISNSDFSLADLADLAGAAGVYDGSELVTWENSKINFTQFNLRDISKYIFDKGSDSSKDQEILIAKTLHNVARNNPIGPLWIAPSRATPKDIDLMKMASSNYWLIQQQAPAIDAQPASVLINSAYYQDVLQRCESNAQGNECWGFSPTLQSLAHGTMRDLCAKYAAYITDDLADTLHTAASLDSPNAKADFSKLTSSDQRKKFMSCLKNRYGLPRESSR